MPTIIETTTTLDSGWKFKRTDEGEDTWAPVASVPSVVHLDLIANGLIEDPFIDRNEINVEWVGEHSWTYTTTFITPAVSDRSKIYLLFEGLDTFAVVKLNEKVILESDNMFLSHRVDITSGVESFSHNFLSIDFDSALLRGRQIEKAHPEHRFIAHNGEPGRVGVRKAQYHWGWDWGPVLMTCGPWRPIRLQVCEGYIKDTRISYELEKDLTTVKGDVQVDFDGKVDEVRVVIAIDGKDVFRQSVIPQSSSQSKIEFHLDQPQLWCPHGYGKQHLYDVSIALLYKGTEIHHQQRKTGFRRIELVRNEDQYGRSFYFKVNNLDVFCGGSCWIPADNFLPRITPEKYRQWLQTMIEGNQIMTRVWGGGIYENDAFYSICDELGLLVWQDFMFACGSYPTWPEMLASISEEAKQNIRRLRDHPCIAIYAGNNEDYQIQEHYKLDYDYDNKIAESWLHGTFPARYIYEHLLPAVCAEEHSSVPYWPSSPFSNGKHTSDQRCGDIHQWDVWHGLQKKYQEYPLIGGRFNSEFGIACLPDIRTIRHFVTKDSEMYPQSRTLDFHNKADGHERRIASYVVENFKVDSTLEGQIFLTQLAQSEALSFAYRGWRRQWGHDRRCGGALVWQLNDCWPASSWAIVDYFFRKKPGFYTIKRALQPLSIAVQREHHDWSACHARPPNTSPYCLWVASSMPFDVHADVELRFISIESGRDIAPPVIRKDCMITANGTTEITTGAINADQEPHVLAARMFQNGQVISRDVDWPQPLKYLFFEDRGVRVEATDGQYHISASKPTKCFVMEEYDGIVLSDNAFDLMPGDMQVIQETGIKKLLEIPKWRYLGSQ